MSEGVFLLALVVVVAGMLIVAGMLVVDRLDRARQRRIAAQDAEWQRKYMLTDEQVAARHRYWLLQNEKRTALLRRERQKFLWLRRYGRKS
jgi:hypothetical protein